MVKLRKERIDELDILRAFAFLGVVFQHTLGVFIRETGIPISESSMLGMLFNLNKFAVPAFVFITGLTLLYNYYDRVDYFPFIRRRIVEVFVPYLAWTVVYLLYANQFKLPAFSVNWAIEFGKNILLGGQYYHLWFIPMIFQFYLLYPLLLKLFKWGQTGSKSRTGIWLLLGIFGAFYTWLMWFTVSYIGGGHLRTDNWLLTVLIRYLDRNFLFWSFYFLLGAIAGVALAKWRDFTVRSTAWNSFLFILLFMWVGFELMRSVVRGGTVDLNYSTSLKPSMFFYTVSEILLLYGLSMLIARSKSLLHDIFKFVGAYSYGAFLAHAILLNYNLQFTEKIWPQSGMWQNGIVKSFLAFASVSLLSVVLSYLIAKIPYGNLLVGASAKRKPQRQSKLTIFKGGKRQQQPSR